MLATALAACATPPRAVQVGEEAWSGRLALQIDTTPPQSFSAAFDLRGAPKAGELQLTSPLGNTLATVTWTPESAELRQGGRVTRRGNLDELTTELSGTAVPVAALFGWLRGEQGDVPGWQADLSRQAEGRITARRTAPLPTAELRVVVQP
ncbi:lipoprotein insertase outer membrane protein LolB [Hydrogenophaga sp.]|uniref:lipoprotein insertase outer membrane protein LolB n=1 Tax=Hydrogenophaga sp. TaxID=1904254 RepID=UPI00271C3FBF|nr:lipoprotein insertase outer membrane protein LolB [Hydrogenophaga sp.]MDO9437857.1 lipoprotein insertase outer membrane protein LolB [Hydrogenophaga sp.]